ncbi:hypothetical protein [Methylorubrum sp. POS3]|uniref:hypothetical protein n=1 Tax=Methylorubrum sp. POS3 TaxID=2998492 RepID=UPI00372993E5
MATSSFLVASGSALYAQCAGCGADHNKADRARTAREGYYQRSERADPGIRPDAVGNALIGGGVTGSMKGAAAGAMSTGGGILRNGAAEKYHEYRENKK